MAHWISSKLKAAETILQQLDQQAAESLRKNEKPRSDDDDDLNLETPTKSTETVPLKDQLKKNKEKIPENIDFVAKLRTDHYNITSFSNNNNNNGDRDKGVEKSPNSNPKFSNNSLTDSDWTELLSAPNKKTDLGVNLSNGLTGIRDLKREFKRETSLGARSRNGQNSVLKGLKKFGVGLEGKANGGGLGGKGSEDGEGSRVSVSSVELQNDGESLDKRNLGWKDRSGSVVVDRKSGAIEERDGALDGSGDGEWVNSKDGLVDGVSCSTDGNYHEVKLSGTVVDGKTDLKMTMNDDDDRIRSALVGVDESNLGLRISGSLTKSSSLASESGSDSDTDSSSASDPETEREREERKRRREQILAAKAAAKAFDAIKEQENMVARMEGEKQSLEKILEDRAKQQALEASELQTTMMEIMEAVDIEKQKHNNTRMEALARMAKLETANADLARSLATAQWNLEVEANAVAELRQQIELKEAIHEELRRRISSTHQTGTNVVPKGVKFEHDVHEAEYSFLVDKLGRLQEKAKTLETSIEITRKEMENPTEVEVELKRRLGQLTDHLIQKQAQVEALSSEKAMLLFRIEAVSRLLDESKLADYASPSSRDDLESGIGAISNLKLRPLFEQKIRSGHQHLGSLVRQLDSIFCAGAVFLKRNSTARTWSLIYLVCLHLWVMYILMSHSPVSEEAKSGAVISLENINKTGGV